ncbi:bifunctional folylpolyglutamate synthase/dihydrofolate synthase [Sphingomonas aracearum]|uniref:Dihydrofolate synthase/folylpolyglutamate synthase n=1 Tax=Sphingomonas aracearum TaxID=2283317 RepID=A0A369VTX9_9SPHN|nr:folylpolyglutamate synthase/dihydrofolate synthase family protein [Sphingomonas aracearum]RDE05095.1 bifunctional folylpolyglutamate synthase/dihydrofolate synthase [Sphingomonas aracearum]
MPDHASSSHPAVQAQLDRLWRLSPGADVLGLERITRLLARLGDPHLSLPPVFHVAGTNGKGSTCAFLRAAIEASGHDVHVFTSPHLVRFNERIRIAGRLIEDEQLAPLLSEVLDAAGSGDGAIGASFFEVTTAAAFLAFARTPAAATIVEVGLGGRLDATNVLSAPAVTGIASLGIDHQSFLGATLREIAGEKAGIAKRGRPLVTMAYPAEIAEHVGSLAQQAGAPVHALGRHWWYETAGETLRYRDPGFSVVLPAPRLVGPHQSGNLALAIAMLRHQGAIDVPEAAMRAAGDWAQWPARFQHLSPGPLHGLLRPGTDLWLDGGHNEDAARAIAAAIRARLPGRVSLVLGMLANKPAEPFLAALAPLVDQVVAVPIPGHDHHAPERLAGIAAELRLPARAAVDLPGALAVLGGAERVLIAGSLYLAGEALRLNDELPV